MLKIAVMIKQVPDSQDITIDPVTKTLNRAEARNIVNPPDKNATEAAIRLKEKYGAFVSIISMGPPMAESAILEMMAMGADEGVLVTDRVFAGADTFPTSLTLAKTAEVLGNFDLIICGEETTDSSTGHVGPGIAEFLDMEQATYVKEIDYQDPYFIVEREIEGATETLKIEKPCVVTITLNANKVREPTLRKKIDAYKKGIRIMDNKAIGLDPNCVGLKGSPTIVKDMKTVEEMPRKTIKIDPKEMDRAVYVLKERGLLK